METNAKQQWPVGIIAAIFLPFAAFSVVFSDNQSNARSDFTQSFTLWVFVLFVLRVIVARVRKEKSRDWIVYTGIGIVLPILAYLLAQRFIPNSVTG